MTQGAARYAIYYAPPSEHPLWQAGCRWLGRDPRAGQPIGCAPAHAREPWRYGFHATLKPPLRLQAPHREAELLQAVEDLAQMHRPFAMPALHVGTLAGFVALRPVEEPQAGHPLRRLADDCVRRLDPFRAAPGAEELARRAQQPLDAEQRELLSRWGYTHVLSRWRFHMTLSDTLTDEAERIAVHERAQEALASALGEPLTCDALCVFVEPAPGAPFVLAHRFALRQD